MKQLTPFTLLFFSLFFLESCQENQQQNASLTQYFDHTAIELEEGISFIETKKKAAVIERPHIKPLYKAMLKVRAQAEDVLESIQNLRIKLQKDRKNLNKDLDRLSFFGYHQLIGEIDALIRRAKELDIDGVKFDPKDVQDLKEDLLLEVKLSETYQKLALEDAEWEEVDLFLKLQN